MPAKSDPQRSSLMSEAHKLYRRQRQFDATYEWPAALRWAAHNHRHRKADVRNQMQAIADGVRAFEPKFGPYGGGARCKRSGP